MTTRLGIALLAFALVSTTAPMAIAQPGPGEDTTEEIEGNPLALSFEAGEPGDQEPPSPWFLDQDAATHEVSDERASDGEVSFHLASYRWDLARTSISTDVNLTLVDRILYDGYVESNNPYWGDIKVDIDDQTVSNELINGFPPEDQWYYNVTIDTTEYEGVHELTLWVRGNGNDAYFDNLRFKGPANVTLPPAILT